MPYIKKESRKKFSDPVDYTRILADLIEDEGELNYVISLLIHKVLEKWGVRYKFLCRICGVLSNVKDEFYRRVVAPYENKKIQENGCVSKLDDDWREHLR